MAEAVGMSSAPPAAVVTDGVIPPVPGVPSVSLVEPEAVAGGPLARLASGDTVELSEAALVLNPSGQPTARTRRPTPGTAGTFAELVGPAHEGAMTHPGATRKTCTYVDYRPRSFVGAHSGSAVVACAFGPPAVRSVLAAQTRDPHDENGGTMTTDDDLKWLVSVDDHLFEPPDAWTSAAPATIRERVPHVVHEDDVMYWAYEDVRTPVSGVLVQAGRPEEEIDPAPVTYEQMRAGYWDPVARLEDMNRDGVLASLCFPFFPRFCGQTFYEAKDKDLALWCVRRYNDWVVEEWAGAAPGRYIPLVIVPLWDPHLAAAEIERCAAGGAKAVAFSENPSMLGLPSLHEPTRYWDPVFAAASDAGLPLAIHFGSSSRVPTTSPDAPVLVSGALSPISLAFAMTDWIFSGYLDRHRNLKILLSEGGIGWIPYMLQRCENIVRDQGWAQRVDFVYDLGSGKGAVGDRGGTVIDRTPTELFRDHVYGCFIDDDHGCAHLADIGVDNVMIETDYPHGDSSYPNSIEKAHAQLAGQPADVQRKVLRGNAEALFGLDLPDPATF